MKNEKFLSVLKSLLKTFLLSCIVLLSFGCSKKAITEKSGISELSEVRPVVIGVPNPIRESSAEEILNTLGLRFAIPKNAENVCYSVIADSLAQMDFVWNKAECTARAESSGKTSLQDISGFYYNWKKSVKVKVGYNEADAKWTKDENGNSVGICIWWDAAPGIMYSVSMKSNANAENLEKLANAVYIQLQG